MCLCGRHFLWAQAMRLCMAEVKLCCSFKGYTLRVGEEGPTRPSGLFVLPKGGTRDLRTENAMVAGLTMLIPSDVRSLKLARAMGRLFGIRSRRVQQIADLKKYSMGDDLAIRHWVVKPRGTYCNKIPNKVDKIIFKLLHSDMFSRIDNNNKSPKHIYTGIVDKDGRREYELHDKRVLRGDPSFLWRLLTGTTRMGEDMGEDAVEPMAEWLEIVRLTTTESRPNGIKGSAKLIARNLCPCLRKNSIARCVCTKCWTYEMNLSLYDSKRKGLWAARKSSYSSEAATKCNCKNGACKEGSAYRVFSRDVLATSAAFMCSRKEIPGMGLPSIDFNTGRENGAETVATVMMHDKKCHRVDGTTPCSKCGWNNLLKDMPQITVEYEDGDKTCQDTLRACSFEATSFRKFTWNEFNKVDRNPKKKSSGTDEDYDEKPSYQTEWVPVKGNWAQFLCFLRDAQEIYLEHRWRVEWKMLTDKRQERILMYRQAFGTAPASATGTVLATIDFAAALSHGKVAESTCSFNEKSHEWVCVVGHNPYLREFTAEENKLKWKRNRVQAVVLQQVSVFYAFSKRKGDTVSHALASEIMISILRDGCLPATPESDIGKPEAFWQGRRIPGSDTTEPLPEGLQEWSDSPVEGWPLAPDTTRVVQNRDRCAAQFQGKKNILNDQTFEHRTGCVLVDQSDASQHGKGKADGFSNIPKGTLAYGISRNINVDSGTRALVLFLARHKMTPVGQNKTAWWAADNLIYIYIPSEYFNSNGFDIKKGIKGSSKLHFFAGRKSGEELVYREEVCPCLPCLESPNLLSRDCLFKELVGGRKTVRLKHAIQAARVRTRANSSLAALAKWLPCNSSTAAKARVAVFRVHEDDPNDKNEEYYLARPIEPSRQLKKDGLVAGNKYMRGWWVTTIKWFELEAILPNGDRRYKLNKLPVKGEVFIVRGIVDLRFVQFCRFERGRGGRYILASAMHERILEGDLSP